MVQTIDTRFLGGWLDFLATPWGVIGMIVAAVVALGMLPMWHYSGSNAFWSILNVESIVEFHQKPISVRRVYIKKEYPLDPDWIDFGKEPNLCPFPLSLGETTPYFADFCREKTTITEQWNSSVTKLIRVPHTKIYKVRIEFPNPGLFWPSLNELRGLLFYPYILAKVASDAGIATDEFAHSSALDEYVGDLRMGEQIIFASFPQYVKKATDLIARVEQSGIMPNDWDRFSSREEVAKRRAEMNREVAARNQIASQPGESLSSANEWRGVFSVFLNRQDGLTYRADRKQILPGWTNDFCKDDRNIEVRIEFTVKDGVRQLYKVLIDEIWVDPAAERAFFDLFRKDVEQVEHLN